MAGHRPRGLPERRPLVQGDQGAPGGAARHQGAASVSAPASLADLIRHHADHTPDAVALLAPDRAPTSFAGLAAQLDRVATRLKAAGIGPGDRVATALPNGADAAVAF